jgi:hypothetical protein
MNKAEREFLKVLLDAVHEKLQERDLSPEEREGYEQKAAKYAGILCSPWFPVDWVRRGIMIAMAIIGFSGLIFANYNLILIWLLLPPFSPRIVGEVAYALGKIVEVVNGNPPKE